MGTTTDEYLRVYSEWTAEYLEIDERLQRASQETQKGIPERMKQANIDPTEVVFNTMDELQELERQRQSELNKCNEKYRLILENLRD